eukprot:TRINITY_DN7845_c0_g1_i1.p1 TRINITY_DN7845_c0_g1~~TRINITY_DN7845_c0_g1_i1.p1  ORF type:complete len:280 (+),score=24.89 TRINITY_DN7845_c0_g1_i1:112-951(+)
MIGESGSSAAQNSPQHQQSPVVPGQTMALGSMPSVQGMQGVYYVPAMPMLGQHGLQVPLSQIGLQPVPVAAQLLQPNVATGGGQQLITQGSSGAAGPATSLAGSAAAVMPVYVVPQMLPGGSSAAMQPMLLQGLQPQPPWPMPPPPPPPSQQHQQQQRPPLDLAAVSGDPWTTSHDPSRRYSGTLKKLAGPPGEEYGFLRCSLTFRLFGRDVFVPPEEARGLVLGDHVTFVVVPSKHGKPQARHVVVAPHASQEDDGNGDAQGGPAVRPVAGSASAART